MSGAEICEFYDNNPNMLLTELSALTGRTVHQLKLILMTGTLPEDNFAMSLLLED